jgi:hypothetical protein
MKEQEMGASGDAMAAAMRKQEAAREEYRRKYGVDIAVVDDSDTMGFAASALRTGEVYMSDLKSMVANVLKKKGNYKIRRLDIIDHGNPDWFQIGKDRIGLQRQLSLEVIKKYKVYDLWDIAPELSKLRPAFEHWGFVHLQHCKIGQNKELMVELSKLLNVSIYAGTDYHRPVIRRQDGDYMRADPNGAYYKVGRPDQETHMTYIGMRPEEKLEITTTEPLGMKSSSVAYEQYPPPTDYYLQNILTKAARCMSRDRDRIALALMRDFSKGVRNRSELARNLYGRLSTRVPTDRISVLFHSTLNPPARTALLEILKGKL